MARLRGLTVVPILSAMLVACIVPSAGAVVLVPQEPLVAGGPARTCAWPIVYPGEANYAWPDTNAAYIVQAALIGAKEKVVISGRDPKARYWSITTYDFKDRQVIDRVNDATVVRAKNGTWTVTVSPRDNPKDPNSLKSAPAYRYGDPLDPAKVTIIMFRVYLPTGGTYSGGPLPTVTLQHDDGTQKHRERLKPCTASQIGPPDRPLGLDPAVGVPDQFIRADGGRFYPSFDTSYLVADVPYDPERILVVTGTAPTTPGQVRYWSLCQNVNEGVLPVVDCASDQDVTLDAERRYTIAVVGPGQVPDRSAFPGVTFLDWKGAANDQSMKNAFLIWRNILPSPTFSYAVDKVPLGQVASTTMGEYAPVISHVALDELRAP